ncbi:hypothetical protein BDV97DRAFT_343949 [Delphinella strobiligena]|nr:hypothetical protein BDV97DRAFT_343949 [Delphinella strobiligena]
MQETLAPRRIPRSQVHQMAEMIFHMRPSDTYVKTVLELLERLPPVDAEQTYTIPPELNVLLRPVEALVSARPPDDEMAGSRMATRVQQTIDDEKVTGDWGCHGGSTDPPQPPSPSPSPQPLSFPLDRAIGALDDDCASRPLRALNDEEWFFFRCGSFLDGMAWWKAVDAVDAVGEPYAFERYRRAFDMVYTSGWSAQPRTEKHRQLFDDDGQGFFSWNGREGEEVSICRGRLGVGDGGGEGGDVWQ